MKQKLPYINLKLLIFVFVCCCGPAFGQLTGIKYIPGDYTSITVAVTDLNASGVGNGGVTFNVAAGYTETIASTISITATGTLTNPIIFQKDPLTSGANPLITAYTNGTGTPSTSVKDGVWRLIGADYITIDGIDLRDNPANTTNPSTMEYGYALYKASTSNGCQNVTIKNCVITLNAVNNAIGAAPMVDGSSGIIVMNSLATSSSAITPVAGGQNSNNKFYSNTIQNCNTGIAVIGYAAAAPFTLADVNNDIGGNSPATGNTLINFGGASGASNAAVGVRTLAQYDLNISYNTINNNNGGGTNHPNIIRGIYINTALSANAVVSYNTVTIKGGGTTQSITGIENVAGSTAAGNTISINNNIITDCTYATATTGGFYGINNSANPASLIIDNNTVSNNSSAATTTGLFYCIYNSGTATTINLTNNIISGNSTAALTTGLFVGIYNKASAPNLNINANTFSNNATTSVTGSHYPIYNIGTVTSTININSNHIGTNLTSAIIFNAANSGSQIFINNTKGAATCALSISNNDFQNINYTIGGTGANTFISNAASTLSQTINGNTFTNLNINTTGSVVFISDNVAVSATGSQNVNNNSINGSFTKNAGGTITLFTSSASSISGAVINQTGNNFSNISVAGATSIAGWINTDAGAGTKNIQNNTFSNWSGGTGSVTVMSVSITSSNNATSGNLINNIASAGAITGITTAAGNNKVFANTINALTTTGAAVVTGISVISGTLNNIYGNKIYDLQASVLGGAVNGISVSGSSSAVITANIYNNTIGDLRTPAASATEPIRGIAITSTRANSTVNVYYNTVYLNATSTGTNFGSSGIYHTASATATTAVLNLRNNIIINLSTPNGTGITAAYRRSSTNLPNYASTSNRNLFYAGTPAANRLIFYNSANSDQTIATFKARVTPRDAESVTEDISANFLSTLGASSLFLHLDPSLPTQAESNAENISNFTSDYDSQIRQGNAGYTGTGAAPDMGADEFNGIKALPLSGIYTVGTGGDYTSLTQAGGLFAAINNLGLAGDVEVDVISDLTEDGSNILNEWTEIGVGNYTITIQPGNASTKIISGNATGALIKLNGADRVTIDGRFGGNGNYLTFRNTNTAGTTGTAFTLINGATNNVINYCTLESYANATNGVILFSTSTAAGGNSNNTVDHCNINATVSGNTGNICVYSAGTNTSGFENTTNTISNNNIYDYRDRGLDITATGSTAWIISGNSFYNGAVSTTINYAAATTLHTIRILGGSGYLISDNYIGGSASLATGGPALYSATAGALTYQGILLTTTSATPVSNIQGNTIANLSIAASPTGTTNTGTNIFLGIETNGSGINIGGSVAGEGNMIGSNTVNGSILITTTTTATTQRSNLRGINCASSGGLIIGNQISGIDIRNTGGAAGPSTFFGILVSNANAPSQVNNNIIGSDGFGAALNSIRVLSTSSSATTAITGISVASSVTSTVQVDGNIIKNISHLNGVTTTGTGGITGISSAATGTAMITISNNIFTGNYIDLYTGVFYGISNTGAATAVTINNNTIAGNASGSATGLHYAIINSGAVTANLNINSNNMGNSTLDAFTYNVANSGSQIFINNTGGASTCALSISNNNFQGFIYSVASTGTNTYILNSAATLSQAINGNTFTNLNVNTSGSLTFISNSVIVGSTGIQNINNNSISGTFTKRAGGTITLCTSIASSVSGGTINHSGNNFSNITVTGATTIAGWVNTDAGAGTKTIQNNTFSNWSGGTSALAAMSVNITAAGSAVTGNMINNISNGAAITGIATAAGNDNIYANTINTLSATGNFAVTGVSVTAGTLKNIYRNKIYDLQSSGAIGSVNGILVSGTTVVSANIYNNLIGDLRTPAANSTGDVIRAISVISTAANSSINVYYNTIYLNATSSGTNFSSTGIYHTANATSTTATLNLRNNSITNISTPKGSGVSVAYRRSSTALGNYSTASNNNLLYAGTPGTNRLIFYDGANSDQTIAAFKTRVATRDAQSVTEDLTTKFLSTSGTSSVFLHMSTAVASLVESGAVNIAGYTDDFDGQVRQGNTGYSGSGSAPDIGADEVFGIEAVPPVITYTLLTNTTATTNRNVTGITIADNSGINNNAGTKPRIYYKRFRDGNTFLDNTSNTNGWKFTEATNTTSPYNFTIDYSILYGGASVTVGEIQYFIVAQDLATIANIAINSGTFNTAPASVALTSASFPITGTINSFDIPYSGTYNVGNSEVFTSLTKSDGLFASINRVGLSGNTTIRITSDLLEDGAYALDQWIETGAGNYKLSIQPDAATLRIISGNASTGLIRLNGSDRVKFDGSIAGSGPYLTFRNANTSGITGTAFTFINGATNDTVKFCNAESYANATNGVILFSTSTATGGNSNNLIDNNNINATVNNNTGNVGIYSEGTTTAGYENADNVISNNNIFNYRDRGLDITATGSTGWTISGNSFYNGTVSAAINYPASSELHGIRISGGNGYNIANNFIGGNASLATGTNAVYTSTTGNVSYKGILLTTTNATPVSYIKGNTVKRITINTIPTAPNTVSFTGIETNNAGIYIGGNAAGEGNIIGSNTANGSISITTTTSYLANTSLVSGINCNSSGGEIISNQVAGFDMNNIGVIPAPSLFRGITVNNAAPPSLVNKNIIGSAGLGAISNSIRIRSFSTAATNDLQGISIVNIVASAILLDSNVIQNINSNSTTSSGSFTGINNNALPTALTTITNNTIKNISTAANANINSTAYTGIAASAPSLISANVIDNISLLATGAAAQLRGINVSGNYSFTISNNTISNLITASTKTANIESDAPSAYNIAGILSTASATSQIISDNILSNFNVSTTAVTATTITGIAMENGNGNISNNRIASFINTATGFSTLPGINGVMIFGGAFNIYNNAINLSNASNSNGVKIYGIDHASSSACNYFHNTVNIAGTATGTTTRTSSFIRTVNGAVLLKNNLFVNTRLGSGVHYAISNIVAAPAVNWPGNASDYNNLYSSNTNTVGEWGAGNDQTFLQWQSSTGGSSHSKNNSVSFVTSSIDLEPDDATNCGIDNAGIPITTPIVINTDINNISRSAVNPDIGAYEFSYIPFTIIASNNSPVCAGENVTLSVDPGNALDPSYTWTDAAQNIVATTESPNIIASVGYFKIKVTDVNGCFAIDSTNVTTNPRPTATLTAPTAICIGTSFNLDIHVTGSGTISGTLNTGDAFSGNAPLITVNLSPTENTTYTIVDLTDDNCSSILSDIPDTVTVLVIQGGQWTGAANTTDWNTANNWLCSVLPDTTTNVIIPANLSFYPAITSGTAVINDLTIFSGASLTINGGTLQIDGDITNSGHVFADNGSVEMYGNAAQTIPGNLFSSNTVKNLNVKNTFGVTLAGSLNLTGILKITSGQLNTNGYLTLASSSSQTALIDGSGAGSVSGNVTMQRYLSSGFGYKYFSSPFTNATVNEFGDDLNLASTFPAFYRYDENLISSGWTSYVNAANTLDPLQGYAAYFGASSSSLTVDVTGTVNNGTVATTLYNHNNIFTQGFNLAGNPYPSPIDWNAATGWTRTNIDNAIYYFNTGSTDSYNGIYSSYINGVSSDGIANNIIPSMQGFFVHVSNGSYPVTGLLAVNNNVRINNLSPVFHKATQNVYPLLRLSLGYKKDSIADNTVIYFKEDATYEFNQENDALKLMNTDAAVPNFYSISEDGLRLSIAAIPSNNDSDKAVPLGIKIPTESQAFFNAQIEQMPLGWHIYLFDAQAGITQDLIQTRAYSTQIASGSVDDRFYILFSKKEKVNLNNNDAFNVYSRSGKLYVTLNLLTGEKGELSIINTIGQTIWRGNIAGYGTHEIIQPFINGIYIIKFTGKHPYAKKVFIGSL